MAQLAPDQPWLTQQFGLSGRTALVTGARTGIGRACAVALAAAGADLVLWARDPADLSEVVAEIRGLGREAHPVGCDLEDVDAVAALAAGLASEHSIDVLVNNAGIIHREPAEQVSFADWRRVLSVDLDALFLITQAIGGPMVERGSGRIISIASLLSFQGGVGVSSYAAAKHAVAGLTKALANEWGPRGVTVNAVAPGYVATNNTAALRADPVREPQLRERIPIGEWATPQDIAPSVVFLASAAARYLNGQVIAVDGGWLSR